ncbi:MAG: toll/interleukin-1 receptor domain-containing protein [Lachnospiraceae bacterium]|nr:toll/interleukin-1 receptor domain-containing protein [Lachnospiraceae bacterium]
MAEHLNRCEVFVAFISPQAMASRNCRREVTYALSKEKPFLGVFLEKTEMTPGMEMQLSAQQCILAYNFRNTEDFVNKLVGSTLLEPCREIPEKAEETAKREQDQAEAGGQETKSPERTTKSLMKEKEKDTDPRKKNLLKWMIPVVLFLVVISPNPLIPTSISVIFALIYFIIVRSAKKRVDQMIAKNQEDPDLFPAGSARRPDEPETDKESLC